MGHTDGAWGVNQSHEPTVTTHEEFMDLARDPEWAKEFTAGGSGSKYRQRMLGYTVEDWDPETGKFSGEGSFDPGQWKAFRGTQQRSGWRGLSKEQQGAFANALEETMANYLKGQAAEAKGASLLDNIAAKSETMEQLIANRRALREEELKQTRGLY